MAAGHGFGAPGKRFALPNSRFLINHRWHTAAGADDRHRDSGQGPLKVRDRINQILATHTGQPIERIAKDTDRDYILESEDAKKYGLVDTIYHRRDDVALKAAG